MFRLYTTPLSANGRKVLAVCHHLGIAPEVKLTNVYRGEGRTPDFLAINPSGKIPALVDGDLTLWESNAILQYLSEAHGDYRLWSRDPRRRADIARWLFWESSQWQPALVPVLTGFVAERLFPERAGSTPAVVRWDDAPFQAVAKLLDMHLRTRSFLVGEDLTLADFSVAAMMMYVRPAGFPFDAFPGIGAWYARIEGLEAWRATAVEPWLYA